MVAFVEKAKNAGISLFPSEIQDLKAQAAIRDGGSPTKYFRRLFEADKANKPAPTAFDRDIITKIAAVYSGYLAPTLAAQLQERGVDQPRLLNELLSQLQEAFACGAQVADIVTVPRWTLDKNHPWYQAQKVVEDMAAEDQGNYNDS